MEVNKNKTFMTIQNILNLLCKTNHCTEITKEDCDNCSYHALCDFVLGLKDQIS